MAQYQIREKIGAGGMGVVYRARDTQLERSVALKLVREQLEGGENAQGRLLREARTASTLNHPNICTIYGAGVDGGETYIAMELVDGQPLSAIVAGAGLPAETAMRYGVQIADALAHAHERGVVHRDLKSANIIITPEGRAKVLDFGLAKRSIQGPDELARTEETLTKAGTVAGTLAYMAPEVLRGEVADARSDLWALGVVLYQALTGALPFRGTTAFDITSAILRDSAARLPAHVPLGLAAIIQRLLAKQPGERYQRATEVRAALEALQQGVAISGPAAVVRSSRRRWLWIAGLFAIAVMLVLAGIQWRNMPAAPASGPRLSDGNRPSTNVEANEYYERAMLFIPRHDPSQVRRMLERALTLDPRFAAARGHYAFTHMLLILQGDSNDPSRLYKAEEDARQALQDDPNCGVAHSALAGAYLLQGRKELVPAEVDKALRANAGDPAIHLWIPIYHRFNGDYEQATRETKQIVTRWPLFWPARMNLGELLREQGDTAGAIREYERILEQDSQSRVALAALAHVYMDIGELTKARQALGRVRNEERQNYRLRQYSALLLALEKRRAEAFQEMDAGLQAYAGAVHFGPLLAAEFYALMGETAKALEWLDRAVRMGDDRENWLRRDPHLASVREHPRFRQILASVAYRRKQRSPAIDRPR